jgi:biotin carboxyl carrier protein
MLKAISGKQTYEIAFGNSDGSMTVNGAPYTLWVLERNGDALVVLINNRKVNVRVERDELNRKQAVVWMNGRKYPVLLKDELDQLLDSMGMNNSAGKTVKELKAPMPGLVLNIMAAEGQAVSKDESLLILEAMKMENVIKSPGDGVIKAIRVQQGKAVEKNDILIQFE